MSRRRGAQHLASLFFSPTRSKDPKLEDIVGALFFGYVCHMLPPGGANPLIFGISQSCSIYKEILYVNEVASFLGG